MMRWPLLRVPVLAGILTVCASPAGAADLECSGLRLEVDNELARRFPGLADSVRTAFSARDDTEVCPEVELALNEQAIQLRVALADGRSTVRSLARPEDVVPTLQALVIVPERPPDAAGPSPVEAPQRSAKPRANKRTRDAPARPRASTTRARARDDIVADRGVLSFPPAATSRSTLRIELSAAVGAHSGESGRSSLNFGLQSLLDVHRFLAGFQVRIDQYQGMSEGMGSALEVAALGGRRFELGVIGLDLLLGPALAFQPGGTVDERSITEQAVPESRMPPPTVSEGGESLYAFLSARSSFFPDSNLRPFIAGDAALRLDERGPAETELFPTWSIGISVGATVGTL